MPGKRKTVTVAKEAKKQKIKISNDEEKKVDDIVLSDESKNAGDINQYRSTVLKKSIDNLDYEEESEINSENSTKELEMTSEWHKIASHAFKSVSLAKKVSASQMFVGVHVSAAGGVDKAPVNAAQMGCKAFALFLRNQRTWNISPKDSNPKMVENFRQNCLKFGFEMKHILPHGSYLLNSGSPDSEVLQKTRNTLLHEAKLCEMLRLPYYNFHPGSSCGKISTESCLKRIAETVNMVLKQTESVTLVLETMAGQGNTVGGKFKELRSIIDQIDDKSRVGVCLDTCHIFVAGYDIRTKQKYETVMQEFETVIGLDYLKGIHLNDSKGKLGSKLDRHENIGRGELGTECFRFVMNDKRLKNIPMILETPELDYEKEIALLYSLEENYE